MSLHGFQRNRTFIQGTACLNQVVHYDDIFTEGVAFSDFAAHYDVQSTIFEELTKPFRSSAVSQLLSSFQ